MYSSINCLEGGARRRRVEREERERVRGRKGKRRGRKGERGSEVKGGRKERGGKERTSLTIYH